MKVLSGALMAMAAGAAVVFGHPVGPPDWVFIVIVFVVGTLTVVSEW